MTKVYTVSEVSGVSVRVRARPLQWIKIINLGSQTCQVIITGHVCFCSGLKWHVNLPLAETDLYFWSFCKG